MFVVPINNKKESLLKSEKGISEDGAGMGIKLPKVIILTLEFSRSEVKVPKVELDVSIPIGEVALPT